MIRSIAVVPHPPLLVPELAGAAAAELEPLRVACQQAVRRLAARSWYTVAADPTGPSPITPNTHGSFHGYGVDVPVRLSAGQPAGPARPGPAPLPVLVAGWLRERAEAHAVAGELVHPALPTPQCLTRGTELADELGGDHGGDTALLVLADGARTHAVPGAGRVDERAGGFDAAVAAALSAADADALAGLDAELAAELGAGGRAAWQVLAGVATGSGAAWTADLLYSAAPYGVGYHVAVWERR